MIRKYLKYHAIAVLLIYLTSSVGLNIYAHHCACASTESFSIFTEANWHNDHHHNENCDTNCQELSAHTHIYNGESCQSKTHSHSHENTKSNHVHDSEGHCTNFKDLVESVSSDCHANNFHQDCSTSHLYMRVISYSSSTFSQIINEVPVLTLLHSNDIEECTTTCLTSTLNTKFSPQTEHLSTLERIYVLQCPKVPSSHFLA